MNQSKSLTSNVLSSTAFLFVAKLFHKSFGIISLLILARLLDTEDYAIVAICTFVLYLGETLSALGSESYLIRKTELNDNDLNTAFTIDFISKLVIWSLVLSSIPLIINALDKYEGLGLALLASTSVIFINAFKNPGIYVLKRNFQFKGIFYVHLVQKIASFTCTVSVAFIYQSYWAPILGNIVLALFFVMGSYVISNYRPRFSLKGIKEQWDYSKWILVRGVIGYLRAQLDTLIVSKIYPAAEVGRYHLVKQVSVLPATDIIGPAILPLMVSFSKVKDEASKLAYQFNISMYLTVVIIIPICIYMAGFPNLIIEVILGEKWIEAAPLMGIMAIMLFSYSINQLLAPVCMVKDKVRQLFIYDFVSFVFVVSTLILLFYTSYSIEEFTLIRSVVAFIPVIIFLICIFKLLSISIVRVIKLLFPIFISAGIAFTFVKFVPNNFFEFGLFNLTYHFGVFLAAYVVCVLFFWSVQKNYFDEVGHIQRLLLAMLYKLKTFVFKV